MASLLCCIHLWTVVLLIYVSAELASVPHYTLYRTNATFDQATDTCSPGVLTTLVTEHEVNEILRLVSGLKQAKFTLWVGLKKAKNECVVPILPLRGFKWTTDGSEETQVSHWGEEPEPTCTTVRCAALSGELNMAGKSSLSLVPRSCKNQNQFICKLSPKDRGTSVKPATTEPAAPESKPYAPEPENEHKRQQQRPDPVPELESCVNPSSKEARSLSLDPDNSSRIQVECWSTVQLELHCSGHPAMWRMLDGSPVNFTTACLPCGDGFWKDTSGHCVDTDECATTTACKHTCMNTEGSYRCVCSDQTGQHHDEDSQACMDLLPVADNSLLSDILIPVLVAVAVLVVLVVVIVVIVKCCLMRRSKK